MLANLELVLLSIIASIGFGIVFRIRKEDLIFAGIGGGIIRIAYIILQLFIPYRIVYAAGAALMAAIYAEILAYKKKMPATLFLYPAIIPLIPGDLLYYTMGGIILGRSEMFESYAIQCILSLIGISIGFVLCSSISHYIRKHRMRAS